jgi:hypothetical protein
MREILKVTLEKQNEKLRFARGWNYRKKKGMQGWGERKYQKSENETKNEKQR